ncbi:hypothetical protein [cf. Phormidesmis sp. LEGE 11477]|uniref:hypothetical protein n=1 Tax=cf. Phormidesmis sp. LEGE 11477 TaxID=1828680 RepID=UPI00187F18D5|nr:hypothetical protein [cf. Phormidesmis sp. LEGE 11477]MBE9064039.1 hypothetical protein [cf. Phormidesmis sp. LEGE 11477]
MNIIKSAFRTVAFRSLKDPTVAFWFGFSFITPLYYGLISFFYSTSSAYIVQDDARYHIVWLQRLIDPDLFPNDVMADYYGAIQGIGFRSFYSLFASFGIEPLAFAKIVPLLLALIATAYLFWVALFILPVPICGALTTIIFNQNIWIRDDLISASPRAFVYPLFAAFLYYLLKDSKIFCLASLGLLSLFYPQMALVGVGILTLRLIRWDGTTPKLPRRFRSYAFWLLALVMVGGALLLFSHQVEQQAGRLTSLAEMKAWPEFQPGGRGAYFGMPFLSFWFDGLSGLRFPLYPPIIWLGAMLPLVVWKVPHFFHKAFPLSGATTTDVRLLGQLFVSSMGFFFLSHIIFPTLYLPSRYSFYSTRFVLAIASGVMLTLVMQCWVGWLVRQWQRWQRWNLLDFARIAVSVGFAIAVVVAPSIPILFLKGQSWEVGKPAGLYDFLSEFPKDTMVASLVQEVNDDIPAFAQRSVLVGREFALPYHADFYAEMRRRMRDLVNAQYSLELSEVQSFIDRYGVDIWILSEDFTNADYLAQKDWLLYSSEKAVVVEANNRLNQGSSPALIQAIPACSIYAEANLIALDGECITNWDS